MRKMKLALDELEVDSFSVNGGGGSGTVHGQETAEWTMCVHTCIYECDTASNCLGWESQDCGTQEKSCAPTLAYTCAATCPYTCRAGCPPKNPSSVVLPCMEP